MVSPLDFLCAYLFFNVGCAATGVKNSLKRDGLATVRGGVTGATLAINDVNGILTGGIAACDTGTFFCINAPLQIWSQPGTPGGVEATIYNYYNLTGTVVATPLPAALPLFATGLGALGLLGWRRKRKAQAAA